MSGPSRMLSSAGFSRLDLDFQTSLASLTEPWSRALKKGHGNFKCLPHWQSLISAPLFREALGQHSRETWGALCHSCLWLPGPSGLLVCFPLPLKCVS